MKALAGEVKSASRDTVDGLNMVSNGLHGFASGTLQGSFEGIQNMLTGLSKLNIGGKVGDAISRMSETLSSAGVIGQIISAILSILDLLKDGIGPIISSLIDTIFNAITGILDNILSGDLFKQIGRFPCERYRGIAEHGVFRRFQQTVRHRWERQGSAGGYRPPYRPERETADLH